MNREELEKNSILTDYVVADLNTKPAFDFPDNTFDVVTNCVSVDYLTKPLEVCVRICGCYLWVLCGLWVGGCL